MELTTAERWSLLREYYRNNEGSVMWDRMGLPSHKWFDDYHVKTPKYTNELSKDEVEHLKLVESYRKEDERMRKERYPGDFIVVSKNVSDALDEIIKDE